MTHYHLLYKIIICTQTKNNHLHNFDKTSQSCEHLCYFPFIYHVGLELHSSMFFTTCILSLFSHLQCFTTSWTVACQAPLSMGFSWQEYWNGLPCPPPGLSSQPRDQTQCLLLERYNERFCLQSIFFFVVLF